MILPKERDPRFITIRRGGSLTDDDHHLLATWAADCAEHVLPLFERERPDDDRPRRAIDASRAWARGETSMWDARTLAGHANAAARDLKGAARFAACAEQEVYGAGRAECAWQREQLPSAIRDLVLDDQRLRNRLCWFVFDC